MIPPSKEQQPRGFWGAFPSTGSSLGLALQQVLGKTCQTCAGRRKPGAANLPCGHGAHQAGKASGSCSPAIRALPGQCGGVLWQNNPVFGMLLWIISACLGKDVALGRGAALCEYQREEVALHPQLLGAGTWVSGWPPQSRRCLWAGPRRGAASREDAKAPHLLALRVGISSCWGSFHAELPTRSPGMKSASRPVPPAACSLGAGQTNTPWLIPWLPLASRGGGLHPHPARPFQRAGGCWLAGKPRWRLSPSMVAALSPRARHHGSSGYI